MHACLLCSTAYYVGTCWTSGNGSPPTRQLLTIWVIHNTEHLHAFALERPFFFNINGWRITLPSCLSRGISQDNAAKWGPRSIQKPHIWKEILTFHRKIPKTSKVAHSSNLKLLSFSPSAKLQTPVLTNINCVPWYTAKNGLASMTSWWRTVLWFARNDILFMSQAQS